MRECAFDPNKGATAVLDPMSQEYVGHLGINLAQSSGQSLGNRSAYSPAVNGPIYTGVILKYPATQNPYTLGVGGYITNTTTKHHGDAVYGTNATPWSFSNFGTIVATGGSGDGVHFLGGGTVSNQAGALIAGVFDGISIFKGNADTVTNHGTIRGETGVDFLSETGASVGNAAGALIYGTFGGVSFSGTAGTLSNFGTILGGTGNSSGVVSSGAAVGNGPGGLISGSHIGVEFFGSATLNNTGTVAGFGSIGVGVGLYGAGVGTISNATGGLISGGFVGISMSSGGARITNAAGAVISAPLGIDILTSGATVSNFGTITGIGTDGQGIDIAATAGGNITNAEGGLVSGARIGIALFGFGVVGTVSNAGTIESPGPGGIGIGLDVGTVSNSGLINAGPGGSGVRIGGGTVVNAGTIAAARNGYGVYIYGTGGGIVINRGMIAAAGRSGQAVAAHGGTFVNYGLVVGSVSGVVLSAGTLAPSPPVATIAGTVIGATGISAASAVGTSQTLTVAGTVVGTGGTAVSLTAGGDDRLILDPGAAFEGVVDGGGGASVLEIAATAGLAASLAAAGDALYAAVTIAQGAMVNFSSLEIDPSAAADASGVLAFDTLVNQGQINIGAGDSVSFGTVASAAYAGLIALRGGGAVDFAGAVGNQNIAFGPPGGTAVIDQPAAFEGTVSGFAAGDTLDLAAGSASDPHYADGVLSLFYNGAPLALDIATPYTRPVFELSPDGSGGTAVSVTPGAGAPDDFFGAGTSDILWQDNAGDVAIWQMAGAAITANPLVGAAPSNWQIAGTGDFNGDGMSDILWQDTEGDVAIWQMDGAAIIANPLVATVPSNWHIAGTGDFNGDGNSDILWQDSSGDVAIWQMNGGTVIANPIVATVPSNWHIAGTGDFTGDGMSDILWQDNAGDVAIWQMDGGTVVANPLVASGVPSNWHIAGTGDYNGDGMSDILWQDSAGDVAIWEMNGGTVIANPVVATVPANWQIEPLANTGGAPAAAPSFGFADISSAADPGGGAPASPPAPPPSTDAASLPLWAGNATAPVADPSLTQRPPAG